MHNPSQIFQHNSNSKFMLFVSNIPPEAEAAEIQRYFAKFGRIKVHTFQVKNKLSGRKISQIEALDQNTNRNILNAEKHFLSSGSEIFVQKLLSGEELEAKVKEDEKRKVTVVGIEKDLSTEQLKELFELKFGKVEFCYLKRYKAKRRRGRGFAFISFMDRESAVRAVESATIEINGRLAKIKKFVPGGIKAGSEKDNKGQANGSKTSMNNQTDGRQSLQLGNSTNEYQVQEGDQRITMGVTNSTAYMNNPNLTENQVDRVQRQQRVNEALNEQTPRSTANQTRRLPRNDRTTHPANHSSQEGQVPDESRGTPHPNPCNNPRGNSQKHGAGLFIKSSIPKIITKQVEIQSQSYHNYLKSKEGFVRMNRLKLKHHKYMPSLDHGLKAMECAARVSPFIHLNHEMGNLFITKEGLFGF